MDRSEYLVVPAPRRGLKDKSVKGIEARFAAAMQAVLNHHAADGWEYLRTDTLPSEGREGLTMTRVTVFQNMLVFRRAIPADPAVPAALIEDHSDTPPAPEPTAQVEPAVIPSKDGDAATAPKPTPDQP
ncbi:DUF4177 domain-containing protein [Loktanella sp. SALINAS62]|uniref:DUF4177 domain-containing protein n=1 Tax=Loktanella sp. SALINAS62 TaxID=2706124 RepID=UPI001B8B6520|nr:DUF4177 domain-containing protein [Loktanella sp. SALINAS62]MBS1303793.1 DUF4177 domain-containing protein [Loktanella sp. SALINAS62]